MSDMMSGMLASFMKNIDFSKLLDAPQVQEFRGLLKQVGEDFVAVKNKQDEIIARLDRIEKNGEGLPSTLSAYSFPNASINPYSEKDVNNG